MIKITDIATVSTNLKDADIYLQRKGSLKTVGTPSFRDELTFNRDSIGIKFHDETIVNPKYYYYVMCSLHEMQLFRSLAKGTTNLVHITVDDIKKFSF